MGKINDNSDRSRHYGVRVGDTVEQTAFGIRSVGIVIYLDPMDNNSIVVHLLEGYYAGKAVKYIPEWCKVIEKVEDKLIQSLS